MITGTSASFAQFKVNETSPLVYKEADAIMAGSCKSRRAHVQILKYRRAVKPATRRMREKTRRSPGCSKRHTTA